MNKSPVQVRQVMTFTEEQLRILSNIETERDFDVAEVRQVVEELKLYKKALELACARLYVETMGAAPIPIREVDLEAARSYKRPEYWLKQAEEELE